VIAHRGGAGLAQENSLAAFGLASALGLRYLETDIRVTRDGHLVCFHDETLGRVTSATGLVRSKSLQELRALRINGIESIPSFDEALDAFPEQFFSVDLKDEAAIEPLVKSLRRRGVAERVCIAGAWDGWLAHVRREVPEVTTALGWRSLTALVSCARTGLRPPKALATAPFAHVPIKLGRVPILVERLVAMSHDIGVRVVAWTVDEPVARCFSRVTSGRRWFPATRPPRTADLPLSSVLHHQVFTRLPTARHRRRDNRALDAAVLHM